MTIVEAIKEAIKHAEGVMDENLEKTKDRNASDPIAINCFECAEKHQQVAEWLKDYKRLLEQQPCDDCVSRAYIESIVEELENICANGDEHILDLLANIKNAPPVTPQPKIGRWIGHREHCENLGVMPSGLGAYNWCSNCDCGIDVKEWYRTNYNYCPNCGAKMQEVEE